MGQGLRPDRAGLEPARSTPRLEARGLRSAHGGPFDLALAPGECVSVVGASGSGKSVLLRLLADLDPHEGDVWLDGRSRSTWHGPQWRRQVVYQAAEPAWWAPTARAHFPVASLPSLDELLGSLGLSFGQLDTEVARLSTGERQRMALARSLAVDPRVLLLDEPSSALDAASTLAVEALVAQRVRAGLSVVWVTHARDQAARVGDRTVEVREHRVHPA